jgi:hypothetical protein
MERMCFDTVGRLKDKLQPLCLLGFIKTNTSEYNVSTPALPRDPHVTDDYCNAREPVVHISVPSLQTSQVIV